MSSDSKESPLVSIVLPCLNEEEAIGFCLDKIKAVLDKNQIDGEIVVSDNGSTDRSVEIAEAKGVKVVHQPERGYGNAYLKGFAEADGRYLIMADADGTYDFELIPDFLKKLTEQNYEFVTGSRYLEGGHRAIKFLHRFVGNPILTLILNTMFGTKYSDVYCGYRAFSREAYAKIRPVSPGMEFNLELAINAQLAKLRICEIPIVLADRLGESKLNTFRDGWRSLRMMILYAPNKVFLLPGMFLLGLGILVHIIVLFRLINTDGKYLGVVSGIAATIFSVTGFQILVLWLHAKTYSWSRRFDRENRFLQRFYSMFTLETGLAIGGAFVLIGTVICAVLFVVWMDNNYRPLVRPEFATLAATLQIIGVDMAFSSVFVSAMSISRRAQTDVSDS